MGSAHLLIRTARASDACAIYDVHRRSAERFWPAFYDESVIRALLAGKTPEGYLPAIREGEMFVAERAGSMVGFGHARPGRIEAVFVDPRAARTGVGSALLAHAVRLARGDGVAAVRAMSTLNAVMFYRACGFREVARCAVPVGGVAVPVVEVELPGEV